MDKIQEFINKVHNESYSKEEIIYIKKWADENEEFIEATYDKLCLTEDHKAFAYFINDYSLGEHIIYEISDYGKTWAFKIEDFN